MSGTIEERLERMESAIAHLQHDIDALNESLLRYLKRMQEWDARFQKIEHELCSLGEPPERRDAAAERPPHY